MWHHGHVDETVPADPAVLDEVIEQLRAAGARFAFLHGSRVEGRHREGSDVDVAAWFGDKADVVAVRAGLPAGVDLLVLDDAPLELAGRVAMDGRLLCEDDPALRLEWQATTRKIFLDERFRVDRARADFAAAQRDG